MKKVIVGVLLGIVLVLPFSAGATATSVDSRETLTNRVDALCVIEQARDGGSFVDDLHLRQELAIACPDLPALP